MRNLFNFYAGIFLPLLILNIASRDGLMSATVFVILLFAYAFIYHPVISAWRLVSTGIIQRSAFILNFIPGWNMKYFRVLYFYSPD